MDGFRLRVNSNITTWLGFYFIEIVTSGNMRPPNVGKVTHYQQGIISLNDALVLAHHTSLRKPLKTVNDNIIKQCDLANYLAANKYRKQQ